MFQVRWGNSAWKGLLGLAITLTWPMPAAAGDGAAVDDGARADDAATAKSVDFRWDIRPVLSDTCFKCHGPNADSREADLRLDTEAGAFGDRGGYAAIVPGDLEESELFARISDDDELSRMPPPEADRRLKPAEIAKIGKWIEEGAVWQQHWSFVTPHRPPLPQVSRPEWCRNEIDRFILARLDQVGLEPSPQATRSTLIRRVTLDLTGLPPTPEEVDTFLADEADHAYQRLVDRLLDSPHYGEQMARFWLDAARYGDTHGLHLDNYREIWPYRDWVIRAMNSNLSYDRFLTEQLAGDLLPNPTRDQRIATGFNRCHVTTNEGGSIEEEVYVRNVVDRVTTTGTVFLGLTFECARCHDHKYDPIKSKEFYQLFAFFNSLDGPAMDGNTKDPKPVIKISTPEQEAELADLRESIAGITNRMAGPVAEIDDQQAGWETSLAEKLRAESENPTTVELDAWHSIGPFTAASAKEAFSTAFEPEQEIDLEKKYRDGQLAWVCRPEWVDGEVHPLSGENAATYLYRTIRAGRSRRVALSLGSDDTITVWLNGRQVLQKEIYRAAAPDQEKLSVQLAQGENRLLVKICNRSGGYGFYFKKTDEQIAPADVAEAVRVAPEKRSDAQRTVLRDHFRRQAWPEWNTLQTERTQLQEQEKQLDAKIPTTLVFAETAQPRPAFVLTRGQYDQRAEKVQRRTPAALPPMSAELPRNRLGLAKWLLDPGQPLTSRVAVNWFWQQCFGTGIVKTSENFGQQGELPSHPDLLDWLAVEFRSDGWNIKRLVRRMVTSATYRQASRVTPELFKRDPQNRLLARGPRYRLDAEMLRDQALAVSGLLVDKLGGPSVKPPQPDGLWFAIGYSGSNTVRFVKDSGPDKVYRRSLYTFWKRTAPPPQMNTFDAPSRESCTVRRERTNTPLQALLLMNDPQYVEAARHLAQLTITHGGQTPSSRAAYALRRATGHPPDEHDLADLVAVYRDQLAHYQASTEDAASLIAVGESKPEASIDPAQLAAWTMVANLILNLDEVVTKH